MFQERLRADVAGSIRLLRNDPVHSLLIIAVLSLGIGASLAVFAAVNLAFLRPLPFPNGDQLVIARMLDRRTSQTGEFTSYPIYEEWTRRADSVASFTAYLRADATLTESGNPELVQTARVEPDFFQILGVRPSIGRALSMEDQKEGRDDVVVLSHRVWVEQLAAAPDVLRKSIVLDGRRCAVVGVMPSSFDFPDKSVDVWAPLVVNPGMRNARGAFWASVVGRLGAHVSPEAAAARMAAATERMGSEFSDVRPFAPVLRSLRSERLGDTRRVLLLLQAAVGCLLLIACANAAGLLLLRGERRQGEIATRFAVGASRGQVVAQLLTEATLLAAVSALLGLALGYVGSRVLLAVAPPQLRAFGMPRVDLTLVMVDVVACLVTVLAFAVVPARRAADPGVALLAYVGGGLPSSSRGSTRTRDVLVACEAALAVILLVAAGLLGRTLWNLGHADPGFTRNGVLTASVRISPVTHRKPEQLLQATDRMMDALAVLPGDSIAGATRLLLFNQYNDVRRIVPEGAQDASSGRQVEACVEPASSRYFRALGVPLRQGRVFSDAEGPDAPRVAVINETLAERVWPGETPLGRRFALGRAASSPRWITVVGVIGDMRRGGVEQPAGGQVFVPLRQMPSYGLTLVVRTELPPAAVVSNLRQAVWSADKDAAIWDIRSVDELLADAAAARQFHFLVLSVFGFAALLLAAIGVFGLAHRSATNRARELGVRLALGATRPSLVRLVVWDGVRPAAVGSALGLAASCWLASLFTASLYGVSAADPVTALAVGSGALATTVVATLGAAWRITRTDPSAALRSL